MEIAEQSKYLQFSTVQALYIASTVQSSFGPCFLSKDICMQVALPIADCGLNPPTNYNLLSLISIASERAIGLQDCKDGFTQHDDQH